MKRIAIQLAMVATLAGIQPAQAQLYDKPNEPTFNYMTIDPQNGTPTLYWTPPDHDPQYPDPTGYIIYRYFTDALGNADYHEIDTVGPSVFQYTDASVSGNAERLSYTIASLGPTEPSRQTAAHTQIWLTSSYDSCNAKIDLQWERYKGWRWENINQNYKLYMGESDDISTYQLIAEVDKFSNTYSLRNVEENKDYYFYLTVDRIDMNYTTASNRIHYYTHMAKHPAFMTIDSIISTDKGNKIYYRIDPATEITDFKLVRWEQTDTSSSLFSAINVDEFSVPTQTYTLDTNNTWAQRTRKFYYKIDAYNGCKKAVKVTTLCNTLIPRLHPKGKKVRLEWDDLLIDTKRRPDRSDNRVEYNIYRRAYLTGDDTEGPGHLSVAAQAIDHTTFDDDLSVFQGQSPLYKIVFKYYIEAIERTPDNTIVMRSVSRDATTEILPGVTMPTSIVPNDPTSQNGHPRNIFQPIISFDSNFTLTIFDRWGGVIYHGDKGWDGKDSKGQFVKEGTYIYRLVVPTENAGHVTKNGSLVVVYR